MPNVPEDDREKAPDNHPDDEDQTVNEMPRRAPGREEVPGDETEPEERRDRREDRERGGILVRPRVDPTRYVL